MFGYLTVCRDELKIKDERTYKALYCGICEELKKRHGQLSRFTLTYDMTFLALLLQGVYEDSTEQGQKKCLPHPFKKHPVITGEMTAYAADMNVLLAYYDILDDWEDERKLWKLIYGRILEGKTGKQLQVYSEKLRKISLYMQDFSEAEQAGNADIDTLAGLFGKVMAEIVTPREDEWSENLRTLGFFLGKFIYLCDAYEDVEKDMKKGTFNPLKRRYESPDFEEECKTILMMMMSECCREFEKLPILENVEILRNILYYLYFSSFLLLK